MDDLSSLHSWLDTLSSHPIFAQPLQQQSQRHHRRSSGQVPPSPNASSIHGHAHHDGRGGSTSRYADDDDDDDDVSLDASTVLGGDVNVNGEEANTAGARAVCCIARKTELCVAAGRKIRILNLASYKAKLEGSNAAASASASTSLAGGALGAGPAQTSGSFKTLNTPAIDFEILQLVPSPSSRFLGVVGRTQLVVLELPRKGWDGLVSSALECSHDPIGPFYHSPSSPPIAKVSFHSWGEHDAILLVLTADGLLREYDILHDAEEPTQITDFCAPSGTTGRSAMPARGVSYGLSSVTTPSKAERSRRERSASATPSSRALVPRGARGGTPMSASYGKGASPARHAYGDTDEGADTAVSFCCGEGEGDWSPFTLYCLMQNGDVYCVCPYLPKKARIPTAHLSQLASFISAKVNYLGTNIGELSLSERQILETRYSAQLKFVNSLLTQRSADHSTPAFAADDDKDNEEGEEFQTVRYPSYLRSPPARQGPFLLQPSPRELDDSDESLASDIAYVSSGNVGSSEIDEASSNMGAVLIAYSDGKVDVCLDVEKVEADWSGSTQMGDLPSLLVYESIDLFGASTEDSSSSGGGGVRIVKDPEYTDSLYIYHHFGAHSLSVRPVFDLLASMSANGDADEASLQRSLAAQPSSEVAWLLQPSLSDEVEHNSVQNTVIGLSVINDVYLGYAILLLTGDRQAVSIELSFRTKRIADAGHAGSGPAATHQGLQLSAPPASGGSNQLQVSKKPYVAFSDSAKFELPPLLTRSSNAPTTRFAIPSSSSGSAKTARVDKDGRIELTVANLRFVGGTVDKLDASVRELIGAGNAVQERLELHLRELPRQVGKYQALDGELAERDAQFAAFGERVERVRAKQRELERKADRVLQRLVDNSQPELSSYERRWIEELDRVQAAVRGGGVDGAAGGRQDRSLTGRADRLKEQLDLLRPQLEGIRLNESRKDDGRMGESQRRKIELSLAEEARLLGEARAKIERMQVKLRKM